MNHYDIINRLKRTSFKRIEALTIIRELRDLPLSRRTEILSRLQEEKYKSDNSDINEVIDDIIDTFKPKK